MSPTYFSFPLLLTFGAIAMGEDTEVKMCNENIHVVLDQAKKLNFAA